MIRRVIQQHHLVPDCSLVKTISYTYAAVGSVNITSCPEHSVGERATVPGDFGMPAAIMLTKLSIETVVTILVACYPKVDKGTSINVVKGTNVTDVLLFQWSQFARLF